MYKYAKVDRKEIFYPLFCICLFSVLFHLYLLQIESVLPHVDPIANEVLIQRTLIHNIVSIHGSGVMAEDHCT